MAVTALAVSSSVSTALHACSCIRSRHACSSDPLLRLASPRVLPLIYVSNSFSIKKFFVSHCSQRWRLPRIAVAVEQEATAEDTAVVESEEEAGGGGTVEGSGSITKLYFGNLPYHCDSAQLAGIVQQYGNPELVEVLYNRETGKSRGFGFVTMSNMEDATIVAQNLDGIEYGGRTLRVNLSDKPRPKEPLYPETEHKLFIGNLSWSVTSEHLVEAFREYGNVVGARVLYDGETGRSRGYGFVCYSTKSEMDAAMQFLNGAELEGRAIRVSMAEGKKS